MGRRVYRRLAVSTLWCLHGNLQQPNVWDGLSQGWLKTVHPELEVQTVNLWDTLTDSCWTWAERFCGQVAERSSHAKDIHYLLGYSLGGRLALHALIGSPGLWAGAMIVSAAPGTTGERGLKRDRIWANRFLHAPWDDLLADWDALPVFCGYPCTTPRPETSFDRAKIAHAFESYSKGRMDNLVPHLPQLSVPITYVTGSDDRRYGQLGNMLMQQCPSLVHVTIPKAGHRVPWEQPQAFAETLIQTLGSPPNHPEVRT